MNPKNLLLLSAVVTTLVLTEARVMRRREVTVPQDGKVGPGDEPDGTGDSGSGDGKTKPKPTEQFASEICQFCLRVFPLRLECVTSFGKCVDRAKSKGEPDAARDCHIVEELCCSCDVIFPFRGCFNFGQDCDARTPCSKGGDESGESAEKDGESDEKDGESGEKDGESDEKDGESPWDADSK